MNRSDRDDVYMCTVQVKNEVRVQTSAQVPISSLEDRSGGSYPSFNTVINLPLTEFHAMASPSALR